MSVLILLKPFYNASPLYISTTHKILTEQFLRWSFTAYSPVLIFYAITVVVVVMVVVVVVNVYVVAIFI